jgi:hypothetical protein
MNNIAIIYHDADFDGKLSNEACRFHLKRLHPNANIDSYGWDYGRPVPTPKLTHQLDHNPNEPVRAQWALYDEIYIVDLSVDELMGRPEYRDKIVWIDHHKSAIEKWDAKFDSDERLFKGIRIDGVAACRLCWQWFTRRNRVGVSYTRPVSKQDFVDRVVVEPRLIRLAGEYDIWDHRDPDAKALQFGLRALSETDLGRLVENQFVGEPTGVKLDDVITQGCAIKSYCDKQNDEYSAAYSRTIKWEGLTFCALNIGQRGNSDLLKGGITPEHDACFAWRHTGNDNMVMVSLYHIAGKEHHDLSQIAVRYGGGGHKGACGFRITLAQLAEIL